MFRFCGFLALAGLGVGGLGFGLYGLPPVSQQPGFLFTASVDQQINATYHPISYAHYGCDPKRPAFQNVTWEVPDKLPADQLDALHILRDTTRGGIDLTTQADVPEISTSSSLTNKDLRNLTGTFYATMRPPAEPGDQTVPMHSADAQSRSGPLSHSSTGTAKPRLGRSINACGTYRYST